MTQQVDPRNPTSAPPREAEPFAAFSSDNRKVPGAATTTSSSNTTGGSDATDRWPSLLNIRQIITAFILEIVSTSRPLREK
jgi:hypothetical protein